MIRSIARQLPTLVLVCSQAAFALQTLDLADGQAAIAKISHKEPTRIAVENGRIVNVTGNIVTEKNPDGEIAIEKDEARGQLYVKPRNGSKPVNVFVSTDKATYTLLLQPTDIPADSVIIRDKGEPRSSGSGAWERAGTRKGLVKLLMIAMAEGRLLDGVDVREAGRDVALWQEARFTLTQVHQGRSAIGEKFLLTNISPQPMVLAEQEFFKDGVIAVTIENQHLPPGASTNVFIVRERGARE